VIADVSGKGVPAALFMMRAKTAIKNYARHGNSAARVLEHVNHSLCEGNDAEMFVTAWLGILDLNTGKIQCANAGHEYPVLMRAGGDYELLMDKHGLALAAMDDIPMKEYEIDLDPGDRLFVYTDGVPEAINEKEEAYGTERLCDKLNTLKNVPQQQALESVLRDIRNFAGAAEQFDDITMLGITFDRVESGA
jgi:serine phosphatase RsbU (regulator of sigma subunit)